MIVGLLTLELHIPHARSLKDKRQVVKKLKDRLRARFNIAVAELDHQDLWQRSTVGAISLSNDQPYLAQLLESVSNEAAQILGGDLVDSRVEFL